MVEAFCLECNFYPRCDLCPFFDLLLIVGDVFAEYFLNGFAGIGSTDPAFGHKFIVVKECMLFLLDGG